MKRIALIPLLLLMTVTAAGPAAAAGGLQAQKNLDPTLSCDIHVSLGGYMRQGGMLPILFEFDNSGEARVVSVRAGQNVYATATFGIPPGTGIQRFLYLPVPYDFTYMMRKMRFTDAETGRQLADFHIFTSGGSSLQYVGHGARLRTVRPPSPRGSGTMLSGISLSGRKTFAVNEDLDSRYKLDTQKVSINRLPDNWIGYTSLNIVIVDYDIWQRPTLRREPLMHWMAMGGVCLVVDAPSGAKSGFRKEVAEVAPFTGEWRDGQRLLPVGMGGAMFVSSRDLTVTHRRFFPEEFNPSRSATRDPYDTSHFRPGVQGVGSLPFWPVLLLLTVFAALVGPLGWWYLVGKKQMGLLYYVAAPSLSLSVVALVVVADMFHEGVTPRVSCDAVRLVDQRVKKAMDLSQFGIYAPFSLGSSLVGNPDEVAHFLSLGNRADYRTRQAGFSIHRAEDRRVYDGVLPAREKAWFGREWIGLERQRLVVWEEDGKIAVENHLNCYLTDLVVHVNGKHAKFDSLEAGQKLTAEPAGGKPDYSISTSGSWTGGGRSVISKAASLVEEYARGDGQGNYYMAEAEDCLARHVWVDSFRPSGTRVLIIGRFE